jgi:hypothetical protein
MYISDLRSIDAAEIVRSPSQLNARMSTEVYSHRLEWIQILMDRQSLNSKTALTRLSTWNTRVENRTVELERVVVMTRVLLS